MNEKETEFIKKNDEIKKAVALEYGEDMNAPVLTAKGSGLIAENILEKAKEYGIDTYEDADLLNSLMALSVGEEIPTQLYDIVAKILVYVENIEKKYS